MKNLVLPLFILLFCANLAAQSDLQTLSATESAFDQALTEKGTRAAFLEFLAPDSVIFRSGPVNGYKYWTMQPDPSDATLIRRSIDRDIASNGMAGYTTGNWSLIPKGKSDVIEQYGEFVTIWEKRSGKFRATLDITISHDKPAIAVPGRGKGDQISDLNKKGLSAVDYSMNFLRKSMSGEGVGGAYKTFAADYVRLLVERKLAIVGKKNVVAETRHYTSVDFPKKISMFETGDMTYVWNPCHYADSVEGVESGNCLQVWKLRGKKWWIVLSVFARVPSDTVPILTVKPKQKLLHE